jgi:RNA polymerase sigma-70 factor (ECF subfamily)
MTVAPECVKVGVMNGPTGPTASIEQDAARKQLVAALARIAGGDRGALRLLYRDTSAKLFAVCVRILRDEGEAEDVLQDVYTTVWQRAGAFDPARASPITWLVAIARNRSIDRLRSGAKAARTRTIDEAADVSDNAPDAFAQIESLQEERRLTDCLGELEPQHAVAVRFAFLDGMTYDELARHMNVPLGTMKSWIRRSLLRLRECLER